MSISTMNTERVIDGLKARHEELVGAIALQDGTVLIGSGFGAPGRRSGEIVFSTAMNGYTEALTDPSYIGQILVLTYPLVGNYGVPPDYESDKIQVEALVVSRATHPSHYRSRMSLSEWLAENNVPGIMEVDTRLLTKRIREFGVMGCAVEVAESISDIDLEKLKTLASSVRYDERQFSYSVYKESVTLGSGDKTVALIDFGVKGGIVRSLLNRGFKVMIYPNTCNADEILRENPSGIVISNGPGNPARMDRQIKLCRELLDTGLPILGVCLGHQLVALACGARTYKMRYGHRGINKPCRDVRSGRRVITLQNHGYAVDKPSLGDTRLKPWFIDCDDGTVEGLYHESRPVITVQFHPEGSPGPKDAYYVFDIFAELVNRYG